MAVLKSFELNGNKQSFANWISNLSPKDTPFTSMIGKEAIDQEQYSWQVDTLAPADNIAYEEGADVLFQKREDTRVITNFTSKLRKVIHVTDTAEAVGTHGRSSELAYQMKKASMEIMRDLELMNLHQVEGGIGSSIEASKFYGFQGMCAEVGDVDVDTGAETHNSIIVLNPKGVWFQPSDIFDITYNLYLAGSKADKIMFHPKHALAFSEMIQSNKEEPQTFRMFDNLDPKFNTQVKKIKDPLGQMYTLIPNRYMPEDKIFFFTESDWTQMVLREPKATKLGKFGSSEKYMIEMEVGLRHRHLYASGILTMIPSNTTVEFDTIEPQLTVDIGEESLVVIIAKENGLPIDQGDVVWASSDHSIFTIKTEDNVTTPQGTATATLEPHKTGVAKLVVTVNGIPAEYNMTVGRPVVTIALAPDEIDVTESTTATVIVQKSYGVPAGKDITIDWIATPSENVEFDGISSITDIQGKAEMNIKGIKVGAIEIAAKAGTTYSRPMSLRVVQPTHTVSLRAAPNPYNPGDTVTLTATVTKKGIPVQDKTVSWRFISAIPANTPADAETDAAGVATSSFVTSGTNTDYEVVAVCDGIESPVLDLTAQ